MIIKCLIISFVMSVGVLPVSMTKLKASVQD